MPGKAQRPGFKADALQRGAGPGGFTTSGGIFTFRNVILVVRLSLGARFRSFSDSL